MRVKHNYPIGKPGVPWDDDDKRIWLESRRMHPDRDYDTTVMSHASGPGFDGFESIVYGTLAKACGRSREYPLLAFVNSDAFLSSSSRSPSSSSERYTTRTSRPAVLITGGVHGYETSGIMGALRFLSSGLAHEYAMIFDIVVVPCVSPWGYENDERWTSSAVDPNRSFGRATTIIDVPDPVVRTEESSCLLDFLDGLVSTSSGTRPIWTCHVDLHETTDSDVNEYRPARSARDGSSEYDDHIPDGFYLFGAAGDADNSDDMDFYNAILDGVERNTTNNTHVAESESDNTLCGYVTTSRGLVLLSRRECTSLGICAGGALPDATYAVTTEMYPDSNNNRNSGEDCVVAQVEAIRAALDHIISRLGISPSLPPSPGRVNDRD